MPVYVEICAEDDGTFTVDAESKEAEAAEKEPTGNEQTFKTADEALAAAKQLLDASSMSPPGEPADMAGAPDEEDAAMNESYRPGSTNR